MKEDTVNGAYHDAEGLISDDAEGLSAFSNPDSKSPRVKHAETDPPYSAFTVGHYHPPDYSQSQTAW